MGGYFYRKTVILIGKTMFFEKIYVWSIKSGDYEKQ